MSIDLFVGICLGVVCGAFSAAFGVLILIKRMNNQTKNK